MFLQFDRGDTSPTTCWRMDLDYMTKRGFGGRDDFRLRRKEFLRLLLSLDRARPGLWNLRHGHRRAGRQSRRVRRSSRRRRGRVTRQQNVQALPNGFAFQSQPLGPERQELSRTVFQERTRQRRQSKHLRLFETATGVTGLGPRTATCASARLGGRNQLAAQARWLFDTANRSSTLFSLTTCRPCRRLCTAQGDRTFRSPPSRSRHKTWIRDASTCSKT